MITKKIGTILFIALLAIAMISPLLIQNVSATPITVASYTVANDGSDTIKTVFPTNYGTAVSARYQTVTISDTVDLNTIDLTVKKVLSPVANMVVAVYAITGTYGTDATPTGSALATSDAIDASTFSTDLTITTFTFSGANSIELTATNKYAFALECASATTMDGSNYIGIAGYWGAGGAGYNGNTGRYGYTLAQWYGDNSGDYIFEIKGTVPVAPTPTPSPSPAPSPTPAPSGGSVLIYYSGTSDGSDIIQDSYPSTILTSARCETVNITSTAVLTDFSFDLSKAGSPVASLAIEVFATAGTYGLDSYPIGSALAMSELKQASDLTTDLTPTLFSFNGANQITLTIGTQYAFAIICVSKTTFDTSNYVRISGYWGSSGAGYDGNTARYGNPSGQWYADSSGDFFFTLYASVTTTTPTGYYNYHIGVPTFDGTTTLASALNTTTYLHNVNGTTIVTLSMGTGATTDYSFVSNTSLSYLTWNVSDVLIRYATLLAPASTGINEIPYSVPHPDFAATTYEFIVTDFIGVTNAYIEVYTNNLDYGIIGRYWLNETGTPTFILQQFSSYTVRLVCDQGMYVQQFPTGIVYTNSFNILAGVFGTSTVGLLRASAERTSATTLAINYTDGAALTTSVSVTVYHKVGASIITDFTDSGSTNNYFAAITVTNTTDYYITIQAIRSGTLQEWKFVSPAFTQGTNPFTGLFDFLGTWPTGLDPAQLIASAIIMCFLGIGSFRSAGASCFIAWVITGILIAIGWYNMGIPLFAFAGVMTVIVVLAESKDQAREA